MTIEPTDDGSATLRSDLFGDTYHSLRGAVGEAMHVFIEAGLRTSSGPVRVLETGFGTGLNAWLTLIEGRPTEYTTVELYPVAEDITSQLGYTDDARFAALHSAPWGEWNEPSPGFRIRKLHGEVAQILAESQFIDAFDLVYWDAFAPDTQPELWTTGLFERVFAAMATGGVLVTYSAKGDVRRALQQAGLTVEKLPGALGKRHMLRAKKL